MRVRTTIYFLGVSLLIVGTVFFFFDRIMLFFITYEMPSIENFGNYQEYLNAFSRANTQIRALIIAQSLMKVFGVILWILGASIMIYAIVLLES